MMSFTKEDLTSYITHTFFQSKGRSISSIKLQKSLYLLHAFSPAPLFQAQFNAWESGPVEEEIYRNFKHYLSHQHIPVHLNCSPEVQSYIDDSLRLIFTMSDLSLMRMMWKEKAWIEARKYPPGENIMREDLILKDRGKTWNNLVS